MRSKRYLDTAKLVNREKLYPLEEALNLLKKTASSKFDETIDLAVKLGTPLKKGDSLRGTVLLPAGSGKPLKVAVVAKGEKIAEAEKAGADYFGGDEFIEKIKGGFLTFDILIATPDMMGSLGRLGKILGQRGLMPNPKAGTVTFDISKVVKEFKAGKVEFRGDKGGVVHLGIGKCSFADASLSSNLKAVIEAIKKVKPSSVKGSYIQSVTLSSTMGPGIKIDPREVYEAGKG